MEDWSKDFIETANIMAEAVEQFFQNVSQALEEIAEQIHLEISSEIEYWFEEFEEFEETHRENYREVEDFFSDSFLDDSELSVNPKLEPNSTTHPACIGCHHYHGRIYRGNLLVCAIHPYGWEDTDCPDWKNR